MIYRADADGYIWARPLAEFEDGRFDGINTPAETMPALTDDHKALVHALRGTGWGAQHIEAAATAIEALAARAEKAERESMCLSMRPTTVDLAAANYRAKTAERERDQARATLASADKGTPIYKAVERVLDEHSAWIARPSDDVTKAIALAAGVAWMAAENVEPCLDEMDSALAAILDACGSTDADRLIVRDALNRKIGDVTLTYGNEPGVLISDHTDNEAMATLLARANAIQDGLSGEAA